MNSIPAAMTWELVSRNRWLLPAAALGSLAFPVLIFSALRSEGALVASSPSMLIMHLVLVQMNAAMFGSALIGHSWNLSRHYAYPVTAAVLVTWRLIPIMAAMFLETLAWTAALNALFTLNWPLWGPALFSAVAVAAVTATVWFVYRSRWVILALAIVGGVLGLWLKARYGGWISVLRHWRDLAPIDVLALTALTAASWWIGVVGVARNRRGEAPFTLGIVGWISWLLDRAPSARRQFRSPAHAQFWYLTQRAWIMPAITFAILAGGLVAWYFDSGKLPELFNAAWQSNRVLMFVALIGAFVMADADKKGGNFAMLQFQATRPMTTTALARVQLRALAASLLVAWAVWAVAMLGLCAVLTLLRVDSSHMAPVGFYGRELAALLLVSWVIITAWVTLASTGRSELLARLVCASLASWITLVVVAKFTLAEPTRQQFISGLGVAIGIALILGTAWVYWAACRRKLVPTPAAWAALAAWIVLTVAALSLFPQMETTAAGLALALGLLALAVAPWAAAPLALSWNRNR